MLTHRIPVAIIKADAGCPVDLISNQITASTTPSIGDLLAYVLADPGATDEGLWVKWTVPKNYAGTPRIVFRGILDGAPGAADILAFGVRKRAVANNISADVQFDAEILGNSVIGSNGSGHSNEDEFELSFALTGSYAVDDSVYAYAFIDGSVVTYAGNVLLVTDDCIFFEYNDA